MFVYTFENINDIKSLKHSDSIKPKHQKEIDAVKNGLFSNFDYSSFKGKTSPDAIIGNWWNHKILKVDKQISPISGSIKEQVVKFIGTENIQINEKNYILNHYKLLSSDNNLPDDKKLDFDIWIIFCKSLKNPKVPPTKHEISVYLENVAR